MRLRQYSAWPLANVKPAVDRWRRLEYGPTNVPALRDMKNLLAQV